MLHWQPWPQHTPLHTLFGQTHRPPEHNSLVGHTKPQPPQLRESVVMFVSQPSIGLLLQSAKPTLQDAMRQVAFEQKLVALGRLQTWPQVPQLRGSRVRSAHTPLQFCCPDAQQTPLEQLPEQQLLDPLQPIVPSGKQEHVPELQTPLWQSDPCRHILPLAHGGQTGPPQSTSVS